MASFSRWLNTIAASLTINLLTLPRHRGTCSHSLCRLLAAATCRWWAQVDSNHRPRAYQARALTTWAMSPCKFSVYLVLSSPFILPYTFDVWLSGVPDWWRWWESNPWPPACRAGALPAELHPHISMRFKWLTVTQNWTTMKDALASLILISRLSFWFLLYKTTMSQHFVFDITVSIERRWSSRTFRYGYLVTT